MEQGSDPHNPLKSPPPRHCDSLLFTIGGSKAYGRHLGPTNLPGALLPRVISHFCPSSPQRGLDSWGACPLLVWSHWTGVDWTGLELEESAFAIKTPSLQTSFPSFPRLSCFLGAKFNAPTLPRWIPNILHRRLYDLAQLNPRARATSIIAKGRMRMTVAAMAIMVTGPVRDSGGRCLSRKNFIIFIYISMNQ